MSDNKNEPKYKVSVSCTGIKKRARTNKHHMFEIDFYPIDISGNDLDNLKIWAREILSTRMKSFYAEKLIMNYVTFDDSPGFTCMQWQPFSDKNKQLELN